MKLLLEIRDDKFDFVMELLRNFSFVKTQTIQTSKDYVISDENETNKSAVNEAAIENIKSGLKEVRLFKKGKLKTTSSKDFLNEL